MQKFKSIFRRQPVYSAFLSTLIVVSLATAYLMYLNHDGKIYYREPQVEGITISRPIVGQSETTAPAEPQSLVYEAPSASNVSKKNSNEDKQTQVLTFFAPATEKSSPTTTSQRWTTTTRRSVPTTTRKPRESTTTTTQVSTTTTEAPVIEIIPN